MTDDVLNIIMLSCIVPFLNLGGRGVCSSNIVKFLVQAYSKTRLMVKFGFRYHQKVPAEPEELQSTPQYGIASPIEFPIPSPAPAWTTELLAGFDVSKSQPKVIFKSDILAYYLVS